MSSQESINEELFSGLRRDVDFLGTSLGRVIREHDGEELFELVERVRGLTKSLRATDRENDEARQRELNELDGLLAAVDTERAEGLVRAFTVYFQLINLAEEIHRVRVNRDRAARATDERPRSESVAAAIRTLKDQGWSYSEVREFINGLDVQLTLTAHPTEVKRYTVRLKLERIASALRTVRERDLAPPDRAALEAEILAEISTLWRTRELFTRKPTVLDEVKSALYYYRRSLLDAVPRLQGDLERALVAYFGGEAEEDSLDSPLAPIDPVVRFRSWIGGDRDGNPFVTPEITAATYQLQSEAALTRHVADVDLLVQRLSQWERRLGGNDGLTDLRRSTEEISRRRGPVDRFSEEPYRQRLFFVHAGLLRELESDEEGDGYRDGGDGYREDLAGLERALRASGDGRAADAFLRPALHRASAFGFHLAALDLREHSRLHEAAVADLLRFAGVSEAYGDLSEAEKVALLAREIGSRRPLAPSDADIAPETRRALDFLRVVKEARGRFGASSTGSYVVSMTAGASDVLEVLVLGKQAGFTDLDATPLFETVADLERAPGVLHELFALPAYAEHVRRRGVQEVMIGYSDSNKDAGFLAANWALYQAQEGVAAVCHEAGVPLRLFHGRGTSIGRGGGPAGQAILAQPPGSLGGRMRTTEQGEALDNRYSDPDLAHRHLEQVTHAFLLCSARDAPRRRDHQPQKLPEELPDELPARFRDALTRAAAAAQLRYRELLEGDGFLDFYHSVTPIDEISRLDIGSRPARRQGDRSLDNLRAIPWVFSWTQCRANLPGWFGLGTGLAELKSEVLREMYGAWPFFRTLLDFAQMSLAKADFGIFDRYLTLVEDESLRRRFGSLIHAEHELTLEAVRRATGKEILEDDPVLARSIRLRNPYVDPISHLQVELLKRLRSRRVGTVGTAEETESGGRAALDYAVKISLLGISAGMRNTG